MKKLYFSLLCGLFFMGIAQAQYIAWNGSVSSDWNNPANWSTNKVPTSTSNVNIGYIPSGNPFPVLSTSPNASIHDLSIGSSKKLTIENGASLQVTGTVSSGFQSKITIVSGNMSVEGAFPIYDLKMIDGIVNANGGMSLSGTVSLGKGILNVGNATTPKDLSIAGQSTLNLEQGKAEVYGKTTLTASGSLNGGTGKLTVHGDTQFGGGQAFDPEQSTVILASDLTILNDSDNKTNFYDLQITSGSSISAQLPVTIQRNLINKGTYSQDKDSGLDNETGLDVIGQVIGANNVSTVKPYLVSLEKVNNTTLKAIFNKPLIKSTVKVGSFSLKDGIGTGAQSISGVSISSVNFTSGKVVTLKTNKPIPENADYVLWVKGGLVDDEPYNSGSEVGVAATNEYTVSNPHKKRLVKDFVEWTGTESTAFDNNNNWSDGIAPSPTGNKTLKFSATPTNGLKLTEDVMVKDFVNNSDKNIDLNGHQLTVTGNFDLSGGTGEVIADADGSTVVMKGGAAQNLPAATFQDNTINNLTIDNTNGVSVDPNYTAQDTLNLRGVLHLTDGNLETNGHLTFKNSADKIAVVAPLGTNGSISGNVTVERYIPAGDQANDAAESKGRAFRFVTSAVSTSSSINANWQEGAHNTGINFPTDNKNPHAGFGTHITGSTTGADGLDATPSGNPSLFQFDAATQQWSAVKNTETPSLNAGAAYRLFVRGDRSVNVTKNDTKPTNIILRATGTLATGNQTITNLPTANNAYVMVGNPYQAVVDMKQVLFTNSQGLKQSFYVWDPNQNTRGGYVTIDSEDATSNVLASEANNMLQPGQSIFVQTKSTGGTRSMAFKETYKTLDTVPLKVFRAGTSSSVRVNLYTDRAYAKGSTTADGFLVRYAEGYANAVNDKDAQKLGNLDENLAIASNGNLLSIEKRNAPEEGDSIQFFNNQYRAQQYTYAIKLNNVANVDAYFEDTYTDQQTALKNNETTLVHFTVDTSIEASVAPNRFKIVYKNSALDIPTETAQNISVYPNPVTNGQVSLQVPAEKTGTMRVSVYNLLGEQVYLHDFKDGKTKHQLQLDKLGSGVYVLKVTTSKGATLNKKLIVR